MGGVIVVLIISLYLLAIVIPTSLERPYLGIMFTYQSPIVVLVSVLVLLGFERMQFHSKLINCISSSSLAIYLFHENYHIKPFWKELISQFYYNNSICLTVVETFFLGLSFMMIAIVLDKIIREPLEKISLPIIESVVVKTTSIIKIKGHH